MEKYLQYNTTRLDEMLAVCKDFKERQNIRSALRELKGIKLDGNNSIFTYSFSPSTISQRERRRSERRTKSDSKSGAKSPIDEKSPSPGHRRSERRTKSDSKSPKNEKSPSPGHRKQATRPTVLNESVDKNYTLNKYFETNGDIVNGDGNSVKNTDENGNIKLVAGKSPPTPKSRYQSFLSVGTLTSPPSDSHKSLRKDGTFRAKKVNITRVKVADKSELLDKSTGTEVTGLCIGSKADEENDQRVLNAELQTAVNVITPTKWKSVDNLSPGGDCSLNRTKSNNVKKDVPKYERVISGNLKSNSTSKLVSNIINHFESRESESVTKTSVKCSNKPKVRDKVNDAMHETNGVINDESLKSDVNRPVKNRTSSPIDSSVNTNHRQQSPQEKPHAAPRKSRKIVSYRSTAFTSNLKLNSVSSTVSRSRLHSAPPDVRNTPCDDVIVIAEPRHSSLNVDETEQPKMKDQSKVTSNMTDALIMSPVKSDSGNRLASDLVDEDFVNEVFRDNTNDTPNITPRKKIGLSRKNRVESDERNFLKKFRRKSSEKSDAKSGDGVNNVPKLETVIDTKNAINELNAKNGNRTVRRKLPEIPTAKHDSDHEDDETIHQRTLRLLQERKRERREKEKQAVEIPQTPPRQQTASVKVEKVKSEKVKVKMSPADLKKNLEQKLQRSDSKKKAARVRRELQLLSRENDRKSAESLSRSNSGRETMTSTPVCKDSIVDKHFSPEDQEIAELTKASKLTPSLSSCEHGVKKDHIENLIHKSKMDFIMDGAVSRTRAVSETEAMFGSHSGLRYHGDRGGRESKVQELLEHGEPATPVEKINLIGNLMQEEARLQDLLRKSTNFSEKRKMRADVRHLRQRRNALEGTGDQSDSGTLRRCVSVAPSTSQHSAPTDLGRQGDKRFIINHPSIDDLRRQLSESQDYDEKKKIRLALRHLRQQSQTRDEGVKPTAGVQRSQSFVHRKSSEPVTVANTSNQSAVGRSQSVIDRQPPDKPLNLPNTGISGRSIVTNGDIGHHSHHTSRDTGSNKHSSFIEDAKVSLQKLHQKYVKPRSTSCEPLNRTKSKSEQSEPRAQPSDLITRKHSGKLLNGTVNLTRDDSLNKSIVEERVKSKGNGKLEINDLKSRLIDLEDRLSKKNSTGKTEVEIREHEKGIKPEIHSVKAVTKQVDNNTDKPVKSIKDTPTTIAPTAKRENQKRSKILERCELFENGDKIVNGESSSRSSFNDSDKTDRSRGRTSNILVSRADVERTKQNRLLNVRRGRSQSEEPRRQSDRERDLERARNHRESGQRKPDIRDTTWDSGRISRRDRASDVSSDSKKSNSSVKTSESEKSESENSHISAVVDTGIPSLNNKEKLGSRGGKTVDTSVLKSVERSDSSNESSASSRKQNSSVKSEKARSNSSCSETSKKRNEPEDTLRPNIQWLEQKRRSLATCTTNEVEKLMSTMEIEAAFSEILDAVEKFPEEKSLSESGTAVEVPILEEGSESSGMEEDMNKNIKGVPNAEVTSVVDVDICDGKLVGGNHENGHSDIHGNDHDDHHGNDNDSGVENGENEQESSVSHNSDTVNNKTSAISEQSSRNTKPSTSEANNNETSHSNLHLAIKPATPDVNGAISVIHGDDGTVTVQEVNRVQEGDTTITEWKKVRRTQSRTETRETDTVVERKITSPGGNTSVYEKDVSKTKHKLTSRGSMYYNKNHLNIRKKRDLEGTEVVEHELNTLSENMSVSKNESWGDKTEAKVTLNRELSTSGICKLEFPDERSKPADDSTTPKESGLTEVTSGKSEDMVKFHLGKPAGCPEITSPLKESSVMEGNLVIFECTVVSSPVATVTWYKGDNQLADDDSSVHMEYSAESGKARLEIPSAVAEDSGKYSCMFENTMGKASTKAQLQVLKKATEIPSFITRLTEQTVKEGQALCLECEVQHAVTVLWYKDGVVQRNNQDFKQTFDGRRAKLEMMEVFLDDYGMYECVLTNDSGEARCSCQIIVKESEFQDEVVPMFLKKLETQIVDEGDTVILECEIIGSPQPEVTWLCDRLKVVEGPRHRLSYDGRVAMLVIRKVTIEENGKMECVAENSAGTVKSDCLLVVKGTKPQPTFAQPLSDTIITSGDNACLECVIQADPQPQIMWRKNGLVIGQMFDFKQTYAEGVAKLEIHKCCTQDCGMYECVACWDSGEISTSCQLTVKDPPAKTEVKPVNVSSAIKPKVTSGPTSVKQTTKPVSSSEKILVKPTTYDISKDSKECLVTVSIEKNEPKAEKEPNVTVSEEKVQTSAVKAFHSQYVPKLDKDTKQAAKSQASKVMLVRQGSLRGLNREIQENPLRKSGSLTSVHLAKSDDKVPEKSDAKSSTKTVDLVAKSDEKLVETKSPEDENKTNIVVAKKSKIKIQEAAEPVLCEYSHSDSPASISQTNSQLSSKKITETKVRDSNKVHEPISGGDNKAKEADGTNVAKSPEVVEEPVAKTPSVGSDGDKPKDVEKPKSAVVKMRMTGDIRRTQSTRAPSSEKPEWLQFKLRKVGSKAPSPFVVPEKNKATTPAQSQASVSPSPDKSTPVADLAKSPTPTSANSDKSIATATESVSDVSVNVKSPSSSVQNDDATKLSRSQSSRVTDRHNTPQSALKDSTNSPLNRPNNKDPIKLTPVSERARIFQMNDAGRQSPSPMDIISKAINLSRTESLRSPAIARKSVGVQRSSSVRTPAVPSTSEKGDVTLELSPQQSKGDSPETSDSGSTRKKIVKYWDPTAPSQRKMDYSTITDEDQLNNMLSNSENFDERKKIRSRIKELRDAHMKEWEEKQKARERDTEDAIKRKHREADEEKKRKLEAFNRQAAEHHESKHLDMAEQHLKERMKQAEEQKKRQLAEFSGRTAVHQESKHLEVSERALQDRHKQADILKQKTLDSYDKAADGKTTTTTRRVETVTKVAPGPTRPADEIVPQLTQKIMHAVPEGVSGVLTVKTESWNSKDNVTRSTEKTETWGGRGGAMNAFKAMDAKTNPLVAYTFAKKAASTMKRNAVTIKQEVLAFCVANTREYETIEITNFSSCWNDGIAFCALIHHFYPESFDFKALNPKQRRKNFELAFDTAEKYADIAPLLDVEDMVRMQKPDWKCVFTYVQSFYRKLRDHDKNKVAAAQ